MKKIFSKLLISLGLIVCLGLVGCGTTVTPPNSEIEDVQPQPSQPETPVSPSNPEPEKPEMSMKEEYEKLANNILEKLSTYYAFDYEDEEIAKENVSDEQLELELNLVDCIDESDFPDIQDYVKQEIDNFSVQGLDAKCINNDCVISIVIKKV